MSRNKKKKPPTPPALTAGPPASTFAVGAAVRVKHGIKDPDYPDIPLGGWAGVVAEVEPRVDDSLCLVEWNTYTVQNMHPVHRKRCERDGLVLTSSWLGSADLEPDTGEAPKMEQPTDLRSPPLNPSLQDDRIRAILQLTSDDPLPEANDANLRLYYDYLTANFKLPIPAKYVDLDDIHAGSKDSLNIVGLSPPEEGDAPDGLLAIVQRGEERVVMPLDHLEASRNNRSGKLLADYAFWFYNFGDFSTIRSFAARHPAEQEPSEGWTVFGAIGRCVFYGAACGAAVGPITATMQGALLAMGIGAITAAIVGYIVGTRYGFFFGKVNRINSGPIIGGIFGLIGGAVVGVVAGPLVVAATGTILGSIVGAIVGYLLRFIHRGMPGAAQVGVVGTVLGAIVLSWMYDADKAFTGLILGTPIGAAAGLFLILAFFGALMLMNMRPGDSEE